MFITVKANFSAMKMYPCCQSLTFITGHLEGTGEKNYRVAGAQGCAEERNWNVMNSILSPVQQQQRSLKSENVPQVNLVRACAPVKPDTT